MGIYSNGSIFGIGIYNFNNTLFEQTYNVLMNDEQKKKAYLFYTELTNKNDLFFRIYTECSSTYNTELFMMWHPISFDIFLEKFG